MFFREGTNINYESLKEKKKMKKQLKSEHRRFVTLSLCLLLVKTCWENNGFGSGKYVGRRPFESVFKEELGEKKKKVFSILF